MRYQVRCSRSILTFTLALVLTFSSVAAAGADAPRERPPERVLAAVLDALRGWLGIGTADLAPAAAPAARATSPGGGSPTGGEANPTHDPNGGGNLPPGYDPDLGGD